MGRFVLAASLTALLLAPLPAMADDAVALPATLDDEVAAAILAAPADQPISTLVYLKDQVNLDLLENFFNATRASRETRNQTVINELHLVADRSQGGLADYLAAQQTTGSVPNFQAFWIVNAFRVDALPADILAIAARNDVERIYFNYPIENEELAKDAQQVAPGEGGGIAGTITPGVEAVNAPDVWDLGYDGTGVLVATLDTGVDGNHPALASRWRGVADARYAGHPDWAWFDPVTNTSFPAAFGSHGTHTMGSVCGGAPGEQIGVAPGAQWIHAAVIDRVNIPRTVADAILSFQWMVNPDGDPSTTWDVPVVCSNSWRVTTFHGYPPCDQTFWTYLDACESAGIVILFSAGNEGPGAQTVGRPPDRATDELRTFAVGAVDANNPNWPIASFSSRGPSFCTPDQSAAIKPEVVAPGVNVRSSVPGGGYQSSGWSGTSMASPHVNGVVALMHQANPNATVAELKQALLDTAFDLGSSGNDNAYGYGMVDALAAVQAILPSRGDMNCDGTVDGADIDPFFLAIGFPSDYMSQYPNCNILNGDINGDNAADGGDIDLFFDCISNGVCP